MISESFQPFCSEENGSPKMQFFQRIMMRCVECVGCALHVGCV